MAPDHFHRHMVICSKDGGALTADSLRTATSIHNCLLCTVLILTVEISWHLAFLENI